MNKDKPIIELEEGWHEINEKGICRIINFLENNDTTGFNKTDYSVLYTCVYNMCTQPRNKNFSAQLYERYGQTLVNYPEKYLLLALHKESTALYFLKCLNESWKKYQIMSKWMRNFFQYLNRHHVGQNTLPSLEAISYEKFHDLIIEQFKERIVGNFLEIFGKDREGEVSEREVLNEIYSKIHNQDEQTKSEKGKLCGLIEEKLLVDTYEFYAGKSARWLLEDSLADYLQKAEDNLMQENVRCVHIMGETSWEKVKARYLDIVVREKIHSLLEKETGILYLLTHERRSDLARLHRLTVGTQTCQIPIATALIKFIKAEGDVVITDKVKKSEASKSESPEDPEFVKLLMGLQMKFKSLLAESFKNDSTYQRALNTGFEEIVNKRIGKYTFAEILACFADKMLKKTNSRMREEEVEENLCKIIELFEHLEDKYLFAEIYKNQLAKRLLNDLSANEDAEKSIISKMKMCCGSQYTAKMEGMLTDLHLSQEIQTSYSKTAPALPIDFSVQVLTFSYWPYFNNNPIHLLKEMQLCTENFKSFYSNITQHRKLYWMNSLGTLEVTRQYESSRYDFVCSPYQGLTLCLFNDRPEISFKDIKLAMCFEDELCKKILNIFCLPKYRILEKIGGDRGKVTEDDVFKLNSSFNNPGKKIRLPMPSIEENYAKEKVAEDRNHAIDAAIVRIMKSRIALNHNNLINEVVTLLSAFRPQIRDIKQRIENLISRDFLERDKTDHNRYNYLA